ncbi:MAG: FAD-dependent oxidoreductase, partial [Gammaproteobacteria bacterium]
PIYPDTQRRPWQIRLGLSLYALLGNLHRYARFQKIEGSYLADKDGLRTTHLQRLYQYWDAQTDDAALTRAVMRSAESLGASLQCPAQVLSITEGAQGYTVRVEQSGTTQTYTCRTLVNAAGPWVNQVLARITPPPRTLAIDRVQGTHIVVDAPAPSGIYYVEAPQDRRAVFVMPWQGMTLIGTTETPFVDGDPASVQPRQEEIDYLLQVYAHYFPERGGALRESFAGLRVLPKQAEAFFNRPRDTVIHVDPSQPGLLTLYGGKLTAYRATAEAVMKRLQPHLPRRKKGVDVRSLELR